MDVIFFVYGLSFFALGLAILVQPREESRHALAKFIWLLIPFGFAHGVHEWMDLWTAVHGESPALDVWKALFLLLSFGFLFEFGRRLILATPVPPPVRWLFGKPVYGVVVAGFLVELVILRDWMEATRIASSYFLGFAGATAAGAGFLLYYYRNIARQPEAAGLAWAKKYFVLAAAAFLVYGVMSLVASAANVFPANVINQQWFLSTFHVPVQLIRAACAVLAAFAVGNILAISHAETRNRLQQTASLANERARALMASEARFRNAIEHAPIGMGVATLGGKFTLVNHALCKIVGYESGELEQMSLLELVHPQDHVSAATKMKQLESGELASCRIENRYIRKDGQVIWAQLTASVDRDSSGAPAYLILQLEDVTERKHSAEFVWRQANFDPLTDLPNRSLFFDRLSKALSQARRANTRVALLLLDLDGFKAVNDTYGHEAGDAVLRTVAMRWRTCVRETDTLSRLGGDEFAVILGASESAEEAASAAEKLIDALDAAIPLPGGHECAIGASVGISIYPVNAAEMDSLLSAADAAMYESKARGTNNCTVSSAMPVRKGNEVEWIVFDSSHLVGVSKIDEQHRQMAQLVNQLNRAIARNESDTEIRRLIDDLAEFTVMHFATEHELMAQYHYPATEAHDADHRHLVETLHLIIDHLNQGNELLALQTLKDWLMIHILNVDKPLGAFLTTRGAR